MIAVEINNVGPACLFSTTHSHGNIWVFRSSGRLIFLGRSFSQPISIGLIFLERGSIKGKHPLIPIFAVIFLIIPHLPGVEWLERLIEGADLLLLMLSVFSLIENKNRFGFSISKEKEK
jgi:hypothetical protein